MKLPSILKIVCALACITAAGAGNASSMVSSTMSFTNFSYTLIDLDANDGITPSITFAGVNSSSHAAVIEWNSFKLNSAYGAGSLAPVSSSIAGATYSGSAIVSGSGTLETLGLTASSEIFSNASKPGAEVTSAAQFGPRGFQLSANTGIRFSFTSAGTLHRDADISGDLNAFSLSASQNAIFSINGTLPQIYNESVTKLNGDLSKPYDYSWFDSVAFSYDNLGNQSVIGSIQGSISTSASAYFSAPPVPEPSSYAMLGAGLAMIGALRTRRRQKR